METFWKFVAAFMAVCGFGWAVYSIGKHTAILETRIDRLEGQMRVLAVPSGAPPIELPPLPTTKESKPATSSERPISQPGQSALMATCVDLIGRVATLRSQSYWSNAIAIESMAKELGCYELLKSAEKPSSKP